MLKRCSFISSLPLLLSPTLSSAAFARCRFVNRPSTTSKSIRSTRSSAFQTPQTTMVTASGTTTSSSEVVPVVGPNPVYAQCMLRINDPPASHAFYHDFLGMRLLTRFDFPDFRFSLFFYAYTSAHTPDQGEPQPARADWLWARREPTIELTWNWTADTYEASVAGVGTVSPEEVYVNGNEAGSPRGFGYIEVSVDDVSVIHSLAQCAGVPIISDLDSESVIVADPDGYHVRFISRLSDETNAEKKHTSIASLDPVFSSVMLRVKDRAAAQAFFQRLGFRGDAGRLSLLGGDRALRDCALTLVEDDGGDVGLTNGNTKPFRGFGHVGLVVADAAEATKRLGTECGFDVVRECKPFADVGSISFVAEPSTGYWVELIQRTGMNPDPSTPPYQQPTGVPTP